MFNSLDSIEAVSKFSTYLKGCNLQKCYVEFKGKIYKKVDVNLFCDTNHWLIIIPSKVKLPDNNLSTDYYKMMFDESTNYLKVYIDDDILYMTSA